MPKNNLKSVSSYTPSSYYSSGNNTYRYSVTHNLGII